MTGTSDDTFECQNLVPSQYHFKPRKLSSISCFAGGIRGLRCKSRSMASCVVPVPRFWRHIEWEKPTGTRISKTEELPVSSTNSFSFFFYSRAALFASNHRFVSSSVFNVFKNYNGLFGSEDFRRKANKGTVALLAAVNCFTPPPCTHP